MISSRVSSLVSTLRSKPPAAGSYSSVIWVPAIAVVFFYLSNPLAIEPDVYVSFHRAVLVTAGATLVTLPWFRLPHLPWPIAMFLVLMVTSMAWSWSAPASWFAFVLYLKIAIIGVVCAACAAPRTIAYGLLLGGVVVCMLSIHAYYTGNPGVLVEPGTDGYLAGVGTNRNILAYTLILSFAAAAAVVPRLQWARVLWALAFATVCLGLFLSQSGTGFVAAGVIAAAAGLLVVVRRWNSVITRRGRRVLSIAAVLLLVGAVLGWPVLGALLGRDSATLSGRTDLWEVVWDASQPHLFLGQGWGTVWGHPWAPAPSNHVFEVIFVNTLIPYTHGHNSLFDVLPEVGLVGVVLVLVAHLVLLRRGWARTRPSADPSQLEDDWTIARLALLGGLAFVLIGVTEPMATIPLGWFVLVTLSAVARARPRQRRGTHQGKRVRRVSGDPTTVA
ncbi:O-antigen ligase family protein [Nocardia sp. N13]|uniref:O-antigen ligase family protein n=1 Tax=Nocardioides sp. N13(2025) TaxID=3453405 RepID=UPI003F777D40